MLAALIRANTWEPSKLLVHYYIAIFGGPFQGQKPVKEIKKPIMGPFQGHKPIMGPFQGQKPIMGPFQGQQPYKYNL